MVQKEYEFRGAERVALSRIRLGSNYNVRGHVSESLHFFFEMVHIMS